MGSRRVRDDPRLSTKLIYLSLWENPDMRFSDMLHDLFFASDAELDEHLSTLENLGLYPFQPRYAALLWACTVGMWSIPQCTEAQALYRLRRLARLTLTNENVYHRIHQHLEESHAQHDNGRNVRVPSESLQPGDR